MTDEYLENNAIRLISDIFDVIGEALTPLFPYGEWHDMISAKMGRTERNHAYVGGVLERVYVLVGNRRIRVERRLPGLMEIPKKFHRRRVLWAAGPRSGVRFWTIILEGETHPFQGGRRKLWRNAYSDQAMFTYVKRYVLYALDHQEVPWPERYDAQIRARARSRAKEDLQERRAKQLKLP